MQQGEPILLLCYSFPPVPGIGGRRWAKFAKELARRGHPVHVIRREKRTDEGDSLWTPDVQAPGIIQHPIPSRLPSVMMRWPLTSIREKLIYRAWLYRLRLTTKGSFYDWSAPLRKAILHQASLLIREHGIRNVVATGAPFRLMVFGAELKERFPEINLVIDFRDEWTWGEYYGMDTMPPRRVQEEKDMEAFAVERADRVISPSVPIMEHLRGFHGARLRQGVWIPHTVDPDDLKGITTPSPDGLFKMIYAGSLYVSAEADAYFRKLLDALVRLREDSPTHFAACRLDLYITGEGTQALEVQVRVRGLEEQVRFHTPVPPREILQRIAASDLVINFFPKRKKDILGTKFHEVFLLRRPILHVGEPGLVSRTLLERKLGDSMLVEELPTELPRIIRGERKIDVDTNADHREFLLAPVTDRLMAEVFI